MIGSLHPSPLVTVPLAVLGAAWIALYWRQLGREETPPVRRRVRRVSIAVLLILLPLLVLGMSFLEPTTQPVLFVTTWSLALLMVLVVILTALLDALISMRLHRAQLKEEVRRASVDVARALHQPRRGEAAESDPTEGAAS